MRLDYRLEDLCKTSALSMGLAAVGLTSLLVSISTARHYTAAAAEMSALDKLVAIEEIRQLKARYFRCVDTKDWDCWRAVFAPDFTIRNSPGKVRGPEGMVQLVQENGLFDRVKSVHHGHMPEIEILSPTTARGIWAADFMHYYPLGEPFKTTGKEQVALGKGEHVYAYYHDVYVKLNGRWRIQSMEMKQLRQDDPGGITIRAPK